MNDARTLTGLLWLRELSWLAPLGAGAFALSAHTLPVVLLLALPLGTLVAFGSEVLTVATFVVLTALAAWFGPVPAFAGLLTALAMWRGVVIGRVQTARSRLADGLLLPDLGLLLGLMLLLIAHASTLWLLVIVVFVATRSAIEAVSGVEMAATTALQAGIVYAPLPGWRQVTFAFSLAITIASGLLALAVRPIWILQLIGSVLSPALNAVMNLIASLIIPILQLLFALFGLLPHRKSKGYKGPSAPKAGKHNTKPIHLAHIPGWEVDLFIAIAVVVALALVVILLRAARSTLPEHDAEAPHGLRRLALSLRRSSQDLPPAIAKGGRGQIAPLYRSALVALSHAGMTFSPRDTPSRILSRAERLEPIVVDPLSALTALYEQDRYADRSSDLAAAQRALQQIREGLNRDSTER